VQIHLKSPNPDAIVVIACFECSFQFKVITCASTQAVFSDFQIPIDELFLLHLSTSVLLIEFIMSGAVYPGKTLAHLIYHV